MQEALYPNKRFVAMAAPSLNAASLSQTSDGTTVTVPADISKPPELSRSNRTNLRHLAYSE
jgi:hypothetical protein